MKPKPEWDKWIAFYKLDVKPLEKWKLSDYTGTVAMVRYDKAKKRTIVWVDRNF